MYRVHALSCSPDSDLAVFENVYQDEYGAIALVAGATAGSWANGEDLAQEAFARAHERWADVSKLDRPGAWIRRVAINLALNSRRSARRESVALERLPVAPIDGSDTAGGQADSALWIAVSALPAKQRAAVVLHYHDGYSSREIADVLGSSVSAVTSSLHKARKRLAAVLGEDR